MPASRDVYVVDTSAVLAMLFREPGAEFVENILPEAEISAANLTEAILKLVQRGESAANATAMLAQILPRVIPVSEAIAQLAAGIVPAKPGLALGDRLCLATAIKVSGIAVTADRTWAALGLNLPIRLIRP